METQCYNIEVNFSKNESSHVMVKVKQGKRSFLNFCVNPEEVIELTSYVTGASLKHK